MNQRQISLWAILLICIFHASAQSTITGHLIAGEKNEALQGSISLLRQKDSMILYRSTADPNGYFSMRDIAHGDYILRIETGGFATAYLHIVVTQAATILGDIAIIRKTAVMQEVTITAQKQLFEISGDKLTMNLAGNVLTSGLNGLELLERLPGVTVNRQSEEIQMNGKTGVLLMVDGRQLYLSGQQLSNYLKSLRSDDFEKIEIVANPSARYEASAATGIINLRTKMNKSDGTVYTLDAGLRYGTYRQYGNFPQNSQGISISAKRRKLAVYTSLNRNNVHEFWANDNTQNFFTAGGLKIEQLTGQDLEKGRYDSWNARVNMDYALSKRSTFGISFSGSLFNGHRNGDLQQVDIENASVANMNTINATTDKFHSYIINVHWGHNFDTLGTRLTVDADILLNKTVSQTGFSLDDIKAGSDSNTMNATVSNGRVNNYILTANFEKKLWAKTNLEIGLKMKLSDNKNFYADNFIDNGPLIGSYFRFEENVSASYVLVTHQLDAKTQIQAGVRGELTDNRGLDSTGARLTGQHYLKLFPSVLISRKLSKDNTLSLAYSRRISRPGNNNFNLFNRFTSALSYFAGNPYILPSLYNSFTLSELIRNKYLIELAYVDIEDFSTSVFDIDSVLIKGRNLTRSSMENVGGKIAWWNLKVLLPVNITRWWTFYIQLWTGINVYNYQRAMVRVDTSEVYWGAAMQQNFTVPGGLTLQVGARIASGQTMGFQTSKPSGAVDLGCGKSIFHDRGKFKLGLQDLFNTNYNRNSINAGSITGYGVYRWNSRILTAGLTYTFGNKNVRVSKWQTKYRENNAEEKN